jgi:preprotein translocase subunit SecB
LLEPEEDNFPYKLATTLVGFFTVDERFPKEEIERLVKTAGPAFLYSTARDMVSSVTGRSSFRPLLLQSAMFRLQEDSPRKIVNRRTKQLTAGKRKASSKAARKK